MDDALRAYRSGHADGLTGRHDQRRAAEPGTGADYRTGLADGRLATFEKELLAAVRRALAGSPDSAGAQGPDGPGEQR